LVASRPGSIKSDLKMLFLNIFLSEINRDKGNPSGSIACMGN